MVAGAQIIGIDVGGKTFRKDDENRDAVSFIRYLDQMDRTWCEVDWKEISKLIEGPPSFLTPDANHSNILQSLTSSREDANKGVIRALLASRIRTRANRTNRDAFCRLTPGIDEAGHSKPFLKVESVGAETNDFKRLFERSDVKELVEFLESVDRRQCTVDWAEVKKLVTDKKYFLAPWSGSILEALNRKAEKAALDEVDAMAKQQEMLLNFSTVATGVQMQSNGASSSQARDPKVNNQRGRRAVISSPNTGTQTTAESTRAGDAH
jgi:hypothetical protein